MAYRKSWLGRISASSFLACALLTQGCGGYRLGYAEPARWSYIRLPFPPTAATQIKQPLLKATRYQIQVCESISNAYRAKATIQSRSGRSYGIAAAALTALGTATTAVAAIYKDDTDEQNIALGTGIALTFTGAAFSIVNAISGSSFVDAYTKAQQSVSEATSTFRASLKDVGAATDPTVLKERICTLRATCFRPYAETQPLGHAFQPQPNNAWPSIEEQESPLVDEYVNAMCAHAGTSAEPALQTCMAQDQAMNADCIEVVCAAALDGGDQATKDSCRSISELRQGSGKPSRTDPVQVRTKEPLAPQDSAIEQPAP
ncbi:hypothetical protein [Corallococcus aberystwythensis]|uniref:hypothetical protein n=1 Tax=Corallococcus aberystwythensis TaxID=2316722 RepID=UPI0011C45052|nr:hypothetical protein [Corallococcus aberystwythensis]